VEQTDVWSGHRGVGSSAGGFLLIRQVRKDQEAPEESVNTSLTIAVAGCVR
jgi:hypothetical protein